MLRIQASPTIHVAMVFALCWPVWLVAEDLTVSRLFSDHMVLQRNATVAVWGTSAPDAQIEVDFAGSTATTKSGADGKWTANINTPDAGGPHVLEIRLKGSPQKIAMADILVGEVWLCSGQSNMEWSVKDSAFSEKEIEGAAQFSSVRLFSIERNASVAPLDEPARAWGWEVGSPQTVPGFSAVAWFFACHYHKETGIPVGLVNASWGGTTCEAWTEFEYLRTVPAMEKFVAHFQAAEPAADPSYPGTLFNGMISPLARFRFAGVLWYQGEANVGRGRQYRDLFPAMIGNWRSRLASGSEMPFFFVQLAPYRYGSSPPEALPELWDAQLYAWKNVPHTGMVVTTDVGDVADIHPKNKREIGRRLALWAGSRFEKRPTVADGTPEPGVTNGGGSGEKPNVAATEPVVPCGPRYRAFRVEENRIIVSFDYSGSGLKIRDAEKLDWFQICGQDGVFVAADARIDGQTVVVSAETVSTPVAVRFAWDDSAVPNLVNHEGLPASPFRTDTFPLTSDDVIY